MTPEERAKDACRRAGRTVEPWVHDIIVAAIEAERERCARVAETWIKPGDVLSGSIVDETVRVVAAAIRA